VISKEVLVFLNGSKKGELIQGQTLEGLNFLLCCPSPFVSSLKVVYSPSNTINFNFNLPIENTLKTQKFMKIVLEKFNIKKGNFNLYYNLADKIGIGCATSSIMMQLFSKAIEQLFGFKLSKNDESKIMRNIEPGDYIVDFPNTFAYDFFNGNFILDNLKLPKGYYFSIMPKDRIFSVYWGMERPKYNINEKTFFSSLLEKNKIINDFQNINLLGEVCYKSAKINQNYFPKPEFDVIENLFLQQLITGFCIGHTGTLFTLFATSKDNLDKAEELIFKYFNKDHYRISSYEV
jgi:uncharacterized protein involved in propanediol utilization